MIRVVTEKSESNNNPELKYVINWRAVKKENQEETYPPNVFYINPNKVPNDFYLNYKKYFVDNGVLRQDFTPKK